MATLVNCQWSAYGEWSACSKSCGGGVKTSTREVLHQAEYGGDDCIGDELRTETCNLDPCTGI